MRTDKELLELNKTTGSLNVMVIDNTVYEYDWKFEQAGKCGWFSKKVIKQGWKPTHRMTWTWIAEWSRLGGGLHVALFQKNVNFTEL